MTIDTALIAELRDYKTRKIVSDLESDAGVNIFYLFTKEESIARNPDKRFNAPRYSPSKEVGRKPETAGAIGYKITNYGNWIKMEEKGYLEPEIKKAELDLSRVLYAYGWDKYSDGIYPNFSGGEITEITSGGRGGMIHRSPIKVSGYTDITELTCGFIFYSLTNRNQLRRDSFIAGAVAESWSRYVGDIEHRYSIRGFGISPFKSISKAVDKWLRKDSLDKAWEFYERYLGRKNKT